MLNGSVKQAPASNRARLVAISPAADAPVPEAEGPTAGSDAALTQSDPKRIHWSVIPALTLFSALAGAGSAWLVR